jgi:hypothetical protein
MNLLSEKIDEFLNFYNDVDKECGGKLANPLEETIVKEINKVVKDSSEDCTLPDQIRLNKRLATLLINLGVLASKRIKQANVAYRYVKWRKNSEWTPVKTILQSRLDKVLVGDIEEEVSKKIIADEMIEANIQSLADHLVALHRDATSYKSALQRQIDLNLKEYATSSTTAE